MAGLSGDKPKNNYGLIVILGAALDGTLRALQSAIGTAMPIEASTGGVNFTGFARRAGADLITAAALPASVFASTAVSDTGSVTKSPLTAHMTILPAAMAAGVSAYTAALVLDTAGAIAGSRVHIPISMPAAAGRTLEIRNATAGGTLLDSFVSLDSATTASFAAYFDGTAWKSLNQSQIATP